MDADWWATCLLEDFFPYLGPQAPSLLLSCLLPNPDDQSSAILLLSARVPPHSQRRRTRSRGGGDSRAPLEAINDEDFFSDDFDDTFEHESLTFEGSLSGEDALHSGDSSDSGSPYPAWLVLSPLLPLLLLHPLSSSISLPTHVGTWNRLARLKVKSSSSRRIHF